MNNLDTKFTDHFIFTRTFTERKEAIKYFKDKDFDLFDKEDFIDLNYKEEPIFIYINRFWGIDYTFDDDDIEWMEEIKLSDNLISILNNNKNNILNNNKKNMNTLNIKEDRLESEIESFFSNKDNQYIIEDIDYNYTKIYDSLQRAENEIVTKLNVLHSIKSQLINAANNKDMIKTIKLISEYKANKKFYMWFIEQTIEDLWKQEKNNEVEYDPNDLFKD